MVGKVEDTVIKEPPEAFNKTTEQKVPERMEEYIPFIRFLYEKRDDLYQILSGVKEDGTQREVMEGALIEYLQRFVFVV